MTRIWPEPEEISEKSKIIIFCDPQILPELFRFPENLPKSFHEPLGHEVRFDMGEKCEICGS